MNSLQNNEGLGCGGGEILEKAHSMEVAILLVEERLKNKLVEELFSLLNLYRDLYIHIFLVLKLKALLS